MGKISNKECRNPKDKTENNHPRKSVKPVSPFEKPRSGLATRATTQHPAPVMLHRAAILLLLCLGLPLGQAAGRTGAAVTVHPIATKAAMNAFERGGNAVDATVAAALALGVVDGFNSGIGGGCFMLIRKPNGSFAAIDGRETAPPQGRAATCICATARPSPSLSRTGALAIGVPGALAAYDLAIRQHGNLVPRRTPWPSGYDRRARVRSRRLHTCSRLGQVVEKT